MMVQSVPTMVAKTACVLIHLQQAATTDTPALRMAARIMRVKMFPTRIFVSTRKFAAMTVTFARWIPASMDNAPIPRNARIAIPVRSTPATQEHAKRLLSILISA
jgi:hypothetical protein